MGLKYFDLSLDTKWLPEDYLTLQLHNLSFDENGIGNVQSTATTYDCRVVEVDENGKISKAILQKKLDDEQYEQNTMPLKRVESLTNETEKGIVTLETYSPLYKDENPQQRYLFTVVSGARNEP
jgi:hypothetical protein